MEHLAALADAVLTDAVHPDFHGLDPAGVVLLQRLKVDGKAFGTEAFQAAAPAAVKMGMGPVVFVRGKAEVKRAIAAAHFFDQATFDEKIQNTVDGHAVDLSGLPKGIVDLLDPEGIAAVSDEFENLQPVCRGTEA
jgi:hypothetical protein